MKVGLSPADFVFDGDPAHLPNKGRSAFPIFGPFLLWTNGWMHQDATWCGGRPPPRRDCVRWGPSSLLPKRERSPHFSPIFGPCLLWPNSLMDQDGTWHGGGLGPGHIVLDGDPAPLFKKGAQTSQISAHFYCGQMATCIKMPLGMEVGLNPGDFVLDWDPAPSPKMGGAPNFRPTSVVAKRLRGSRCRLVWPRRLCVRWGPSYPRKKRHTHPTQFLAHVYCGQTAGWIKMPLGTEVNLGPGNVELDAVAAPPKRVTAPSFRFMSILAKQLDG